MLQLLKSINSEDRSPNWAGAAFNTNNLLNMQRNLDYLRLPPMSDFYVGKVWNHQEILANQLSSSPVITKKKYKSKIVSGRFNKAKKQEYYKNLE